MLQLTGRLSLSELADFCDRFGTSLHVGIDPRRAIQSEIARAPMKLRRCLQLVSEELEHGASLSSAFAASRASFPPLFLELLDVGERTGKVDEVLLRQAVHYRRLKELARTV